MKFGEIDYSSYNNAIEQLAKSLEYSKSDLAHSDPDLFHQFRNSVIQCFEFTYELSWKMLKRRLEADSASPDEIDNLSFKELIRTGAEKGFIDDPLVWFKYRELRNQTAHAYSEEKASAVYSEANPLLESAKHLYSRLV
jgi:nucleotidyltransferase substrate binding protein (TIGR01987 family)